MTKVIPVKFLEFPINSGNKILNNHFVKTPMMTDSTENIDNEYVLTAIKRPDIKAIKRYLNENFATNVQKELIEGIVM